MLTVIVGMIVVPLALYFTNQGPAPVPVPPIQTATAAPASGVTSPARP